MNWELGFSEDKNIQPLEFVDAYVPSDVQLVYKKQKGMKDYNFGSNYMDYKWMENMWWSYRTTLDVLSIDRTVPMLLFKGLDYSYTISINDNVIIEDEGMFTPVEINLKQYCGSTIELLVQLHPVPKKYGVPEGRIEASLCCKPAVSYGWDWHPRLIPIGIYDDVELNYKPETHVETVDISYTISEDLTSLQGFADIKIASPSGTITFEMIDMQGTAVYTATESAKSFSRIDFVLAKPCLWWCIDQGEQYLYTIRVRIITEDKCLDEYKKSIGFRKIKLIMNEGAWEGTPFPKTQGKPPITIELNGRRIFGKGTNFVPPEIFTSLLNHEKYRKLLTLARDCNMNLLRLWGGGLVNKDSFYELCDQMGLMVWQEFPLACNNYEDDAHYLKVLGKESTSIITRLKKHPCVIIWCGGNELFCSWGGMTNQSLALRLLDRNCYELDPHTPYIMTSPQYGMGHGHYMPMSAPDREAISDIIDSDFTAYTEFGIPSPSPFDYIKGFIPEEEWMTPESGTAWEHHHAINAWDMKNDTWFCMDQIRAYFGQEKGLEELIDNGVILQYEVYKHIFEEARRKWPKTSMALNWCFNEPWPSAANNSIVNYPDIPKYGFYGVQKALRNQMFSARIHKMILHHGENPIVELYILNDLPQPLESLSVRVFLSTIDGHEILPLGEYQSGICEANSVCKIAAFEFSIGDNLPDRCRLNLQCIDERFSNDYLLFIK